MSNISQNMWRCLKQQFSQTRKQMLDKGQLQIKGRTMKFTKHIKGNKPKNGYILVIGLHGGGGCPKDVNDQQYENHKTIYNQKLPDGTIWIAPRSPQDDWNMWWKDYIDDFLIQISRALILNDMVDPNKIYLTGYSAGGDGVYHLAPRMADFLAGASMMAGHPNQAEFINLRNIKFAIRLGQLDNPYNRVNQAIKCSRMLAQLRQNYGGYQNNCQLVKDKPHWMDLQDAKVFPWLFNSVRNPYPEVILFKQCKDKRKKLFYYLRFQNINSDQQVLVIKQGNTFNIYSNQTITILLNTKLIDQTKPIKVIHNGQLTVQRELQIKQNVCQKTMLQRIDPFYIFQDQIISKSNQKIDINEQMFNIFQITKEQKDAQYQRGLPNSQQKMKENFNKSMQPSVPRTKQLPQKFKKQENSNLLGGIHKLLNLQDSTANPIDIIKAAQCKCNIF